MIKRLVFCVILFFSFISCERDIGLFETYSVPITDVGGYDLFAMDVSYVNGVLCSLVDVNNFRSSFDVSHGISYYMVDEGFGYSFCYCYRIVEGYYSGMVSEIGCDGFLCLNRSSSLYVDGGNYVCRLVNVLIFNVGGMYYEIPYVICVVTDLHEVIDVSLLFSY